MEFLINISSYKPFFQKVVNPITIELDNYNL